MPVSGAERFVCIHGHFYQPPRENPWLEEVEIQDSAAPYHDWNERVTAECYAPNAAARLLDEKGAIAALRNNYEHISFNFGPTLLAWMERKRPNVYAQILLADQESCRRLGRGNALAQVYGHCIMPLASPRDQQTQVRWGIADFVHRFGRRPEGMWLPETAVDRRTLAVLAENGIRFTILAPSQAARVRHGAGPWRDVASAGLDCTRPYRCAVGSGRSIILFFYDGEIAQAVAFSGLLSDGREVARRLLAKAATRRVPALVHIATDGETYGHHHRFGEMALASAIELLAQHKDVQLTNYAAYLDHVAVEDEVEIRENTSWSCAHGVERWRANCGCRVGGQPGWQQSWRAPLRHALDWLKSQLDTLFERHAANLLRDPWAARDAYIAVILQRDAERAHFLERHARPKSLDLERSRIWKLLEVERNALLSFTSCGWFFDEPTGIETVQVLSYACRALQLAGEFGVNLEPEFLRRLQPLRSNLPSVHDGRHLYRQLVRPLLADSTRIVAHYAMNSLFEAPAPQQPVYASRMDSLDRAFEHAGKAEFAVGRVRWTSTITENSAEYVYAALHLGGHDIHCAVAADNANLPYAQLEPELMQAFFAESLGELVRRIDRAFGGAFFSLRDVFTAERRRILDGAMAEVMAECTAGYERMVSQNRRLLNFLMKAAVPLPAPLRVAAGFVLQRRLEEAVTRFVAGAENADASVAVWNEGKRWGITPETEGVRDLLKGALLDAVMRLTYPDAEACVARAHSSLDLAATLGLQLNTWEAQNQYYVLITTNHHERWSAAARAEIRRLGERLSFRLREWEGWDVVVSRAREACS